jgi:hypothetical protein
MGRETAFFVFLQETNSPIYFAILFQLLSFGRPTARACPGRWQGKHPSDTTHNPANTKPQPNQHRNFHAEKLNRTKHTVYPGANAFQTIKRRRRNPALTTLPSSSPPSTATHPWLFDGVPDAGDIP